MTIFARGKPQSNRLRTEVDNFEPVTVAEWSINKRDIVRVTLELYKGFWLVNFCKWFNAAAGERRPAKQGIAFRVQHLPRLAETITSALSIARERGLIETVGDQCTTD